MTLDDFRAEYPEYDDMPDDEVMELISAESEEDDEPEPICAPGIESGLSDIAGQLQKIISHITKKQKPDKDDAALLAIGLQLQGIESAIKNVKMPVFEATTVTIPENKQIEYLEIKRDELNYITRLIPKYR